MRWMVVDAIFFFLLYVVPEIWRQGIVALMRHVELGKS